MNGKSFPFTFKAEYVNEPDNLPEWWRRASAVPDQDKFNKLCDEAAKLTEYRVISQIARIINAGLLTDKTLWPAGWRTRLPQLVLERCKDRNVLARQWPHVRVLRGRTLGNSQNELRLVMSWIIMGVVTNLIIEELDKE